MGYGESVSFKERTVKRWQWVFLVLLVLLFGSCTYGFLSGLRSEVYHGRVVDKETGSPLAGTVVTVIWIKTAAISIEGGPNFFLNAQETVADADGEFSLRVSPGLNWHPFTVRVAEPKIIIFKPGYQPAELGSLVQLGFRSTSELIAALKEGAAIRLPKLKTKEEIERFVSFGPVGIPPKATPNFIAAINEQRKLAGLGPLL
jgi:hypothetical protein